MDFITINDIKIPALGYGTWKLGGSECVHSVEMALAHGYRHIDTAQIYENEAEVGQALKNSGIARDNIFLTTKVWIENLSPAAMRRSVEESLRKLKVDAVDLLLIHWPVEKDASYKEQLATLTALQKEGRTRLIGVSNFTVPLLQLAIEECGAPIVTNQVEYHPYLSQQPVLQYLKAKGLFLTAYSPVARGKILQDPVIQRIAEAHTKKPSQVALRWLLQQGMVAAIPKAASENHIKDNMALFDFSLTNAEMNEITALAHPEGRMINPDWAPAWDKA